MFIFKYNPISRKNNNKKTIIHFKNWPIFIQIVTVLANIIFVKDCTDRQEKREWSDLLDFIVFVK